MIGLRHNMDISVLICGFCRILARFFCFIFVLSVHTILFAATEGRVTYDFEPSVDELPIMHSYVSEYAFIDVEAVADVFDLQYQVYDAYDNDIPRKRICIPPKSP